MNYFDRMTFHIKVADYAREHKELTQREIGRHFGIEQATVSHICLASGYSRNALLERCTRWHRLPQLVGEVSEALRSNLSNKKIAAKFNLTTEEVWSIQNHIGLKHRPKESHSTREPLTPERRKFLTDGYARWIAQKKNSLTTPMVKESEEQTNEQSKVKY